MTGELWLEDIHVGHRLPTDALCSALALQRDGFDAWAKLVIDADTDTLLGATFVGPEFAELVQAATLAVVAKVPVEVLRHVVPPHPTVSQIWNPLLARER